MIDITVHNLIKSFEIGNNVLDGLSFSVTHGERIGILGVNGSGKTTLFRILSGDLSYDEGEVAIRPGARIGLISQIPVYPDGWTTEDVLRQSMKELDRIEERMRTLETILESCSDRAYLNEYDELQDRFRRLGGFEADAEINRVANGLDIDSEMRRREFELLSGGEKTRVNLARLILEDTDILLLDEPTNHLDLHATEWLEDYISRFKGTVLAISHDRYFLDKIAQRCIEIADGKAEFYSGNYSFFVEERQRRFNERMKQYEKDSAKVEQLERAVAQMRLWAFMGNDKLYKRAFSMEKRIDKLKTTERPTQSKKLSVRFKEADFLGDDVIALSGISKRYEDRVLLNDFDLEVIGCESIAIIGDNGTGKSTLTKIITGELSADSGMIYVGPQVRMACLPQIVRFEDENRNMIDTMLYECRCTPQEARDRLASFGFRGESVMTRVGALSGGERSRLKLCMLMGSNINLLILDEPTNHLDIASREWMESALADYEQTLLFVSHDRFFVDKFATRILSFEGNGEIIDYRGKYKDYLDWKSRQTVYLREDKAREKSAAPVRPATPKNASRNVSRIEREIEKLEKELSVLSAEAELCATDYLRLMEIEDARSELNEKLEDAYRRWEEAAQ